MRSRTYFTSTCLFIGAALALVMPGCGDAGDESTFGAGQNANGGGDAGGGGGNLFGSDGSLGGGGDGSAPCVNLCQQQVQCPGGGTTSLSGTVYDPAGKVPLYNVLVYVPNSTPAPITHGASCDRCGSPLSGDPLVTTLTDAAGHFSLKNVPVGSNIPLVIQIGKWRRQLTIPTVASCVDTNLSDKNLTRLPRNQSEGDIPLIALTTGAADALECLLGKKKIGLDDSEFSTAGGSGRVHLYGGFGYGSTKATSKFDTSMGGSDFAGAQPLWSDVDKLKAYDMVILSCEGNENKSTKPQGALQALHDYAAAGGRVFATHWHEYWFRGGSPAPFQSIGAWRDPAAEDPPGTTTGTIDQSFPKGQALAEWLMNVGGSTTKGQLQIKEARHNLDSVVPALAQKWITVTNANDSNSTAVEYVSFNTPLGVPEEQQCGRAVYNDLHVSSGGGDSPGPAYPSGCTTTDLTPQEKALEFMLFDLSACVQDDNSTPTAPPPVVH